MTAAGGLAACREASTRSLGLRIMTCNSRAVWLHEGKLAEMATGEGKTLVATCPCTSDPSTKKALMSCGE